MPTDDNYTWVTCPENKEGSICKGQVALKLIAHRFQDDADEVAVNTISLKVTTTENPNRESLTQKIHPKMKPNPTPKARKKNQKIHPTRESTKSSPH